MRTIDDWMEAFDNTVYSHLDAAADERCKVFLKEVQTDAKPQWMLIESAPKDGTWLLAYGTAGVFVGKWSKHFTDWIDGSDLIRQPSHWQPLPIPPKAQP